MALSINDFGKAVVAAGLIPASELMSIWDALTADARPKNAEAFARLLIKQGTLNEFQSQELLSVSGLPLVLGDYVLLAKIGAGGMGQVFKAQHRHMKRLAAIKLLPAAMTQNEGAVKRFQREVQAAAKLSHPNIVQTFDAGVQRDVWYLVMECVEGSDLSAFVKERGPLPINGSVDCILQAARGLAYAHGEGVVHRDIKPSNLLLDKKGTVKILDMGLARFDASGDAADQQLTSTGQVMGTVDYMAPEQSTNTHDADARSDIYSLGCTMFRLLTGENVYHGETVAKRIMAHFNDPIPSICGKRPEVPVEIDRIFHKMVAKQPADRYQQVSQLVADLEAWRHPEATSTFSPSASSEQDSELTYSLRPLTAKGGPATAAPESATISRLPQTAHEQTISQFEADRENVVQGHSKRVKPSSKGTGGSRKPANKLIAAGIAGILLLLLGMWVIVRDKDGKEVAKLNVPPGGPVEAASQKTDQAQNPKPQVANPKSEVQAPNSSSPPIAKGPFDVHATPAPVDDGPTKAPFDASQAKAHQEAWAKRLGSKVESVNSAGMSMTLVPPGEFMMGSTPEQNAVGRKMGEADQIKVANNPYFILLAAELPQHRVVITKPFLLGTTEVTVGQFRKFIAATRYVTEAERYGSGNSAEKSLNGRVKESQKGVNWKNPGHPQTDESAVSQVTWNDAVAFCNWLSEQDQRRPWYRADGQGGWLIAAQSDGYRLPTEAEWEYACRAGTTTQFSCGDDVAQLTSYAWRNNNSLGVQPVRLKLPNGFGLYDMHGNVREWCQDLYDDKWYANRETSDPIGPFSGLSRVLRGGAWSFSASDCRCALRCGMLSWSRLGSNGFRCLRVLDTAPTAGISTPVPVVEGPAITPPNMTPTPVPEIKPKAPLVKDSRLAIPGEAAQEQAKQLLQEIFKAELARAKQPEQKTALAEKLLKQAESAADDPASKYVMLQEALRLAIDAADVEMLERIVVRMSAGYAVEGMDIRIDALEKAFAKPHSSALSKSLAEAALGPLQELESNEQFERAERFQAIVLAAARKSKDADLVKILVERGKSLTAGKQQLAAVEQARAVLAQNPDDADANLALGKYLCFVKEEWEPGLAHLAEGSNPILAELAMKSLVDPMDANAQVVLGDAWWNAAEGAKGAGKADLQAGSRYWYAKAAPQLTGLAKAKVEQRLESLSGSLSKPSKAVPPIAKAPFSAQQARAHQVAWGKHLRTPIAFVSRTGVPLVLIPPGEFLMGSSDQQVAAALKLPDETNSDQLTKDLIQRAERPQHKVVIAKPFLMSATEVTVGQFRKFIEATNYITEAEQYGFGNSSEKIFGERVTAISRGLNWKSPGYTVNDELPVSQITWNDACAYCAWLSTQEQRTTWYRTDGKGGWLVATQASGYRLPTEAEWEYACRAGTTTQYWFGDDHAELPKYGWYVKNASGGLQPVASKLPNPFGLFDMHGNLAEWCQDFWDEKWYEKKSPPNDSNGPTAGTHRVIRGGYWVRSDSSCRSASRYNSMQSSRFMFYGFRCVREW